MLWIAEVRRNFKLLKKAQVVAFRTLRFFKPLQRLDRLSMSESDVCRRQILTFKVGPALKELTYL